MKDTTGFTPITLAQAIVAITDGKTVYVEDSRCRNLVEARNLGIKFRPRLDRFDVTYKVALWWRSFQTSNPECQGFWLKD